MESPDSPPGCTYCEISGDLMRLVSSYLDLLPHSLSWIGISFETGSTFSIILATWLLYSAMENWSFCRGLRSAATTSPIVSSMVYLDLSSDGGLKELMHILISLVVLLICFSRFGQKGTFSCANWKVVSVAYIAIWLNFWIFEGSCTQCSCFHCFQHKNFPIHSRQNFP